MGFRKAATHFSHAAISVIIAGVLFQAEFTNSGLWILKNVSGFIFTLFAIGSFHISILNPADSHSMKTVWTVYLIGRLLSILSYVMFNRARKTCRKVKETQDKVLLEILQDGAKTQYGTDYNLEKITDRENFRKSHPLTDYAHYSAYIDRILEGEQNVMTTSKVVFIAMTSGTTGKNKMFPVTANYVTKSIVTGGAAMYPRREHMFGDLGRTVAIRMKPTLRSAPCGLTMSSITHHFGGQPSFGTTPPCCYDVIEEKTAMYLHSVFALAEPEVSVLDAMLSSLAHALFRTMFENQADLCDDIERGQVKANLDIPSEIREEVNKRLKPNRGRAEELRRELKRGGDGFARRIWKQLRFGLYTCTGSFTHYARILDASYMKGVPCGTFCLLASEGNIGAVPCHDKPDEYRLTISDIFFEFIKESDVQDEKPQTYFADQLTVGESYEVVLTNRFGLYRYRLGDVIQIIGHYEETPLYRYRYRLGQLLNVSNEKYPENVFYDAINAAEHMLTPGVSVADYVATESPVLDPLREDEGGCSSKHYTLFVEVNSENTYYTLSGNEKVNFDTCLRHKFINYDKLRDKGSISRMEVIQVKQGTFPELIRILKKEYRTQQFKLPRALRREDGLRFLLSQEL